MGPDLQLKGQSKAAAEVSINKEDRNAPQDFEDKLVLCASNCEDNNFDMDPSIGSQPTVSGGSYDVDVNITEGASLDKYGIDEAKFDDVTASSSSFSDTDISTTSDAEAESHLLPFDSTNLPYDDFGGTVQVRKKKLTAHWRRFIHPLMWRCKWLELRIRELQRQTLKYDGELAKYDQRKQFEFEKPLMDVCDAKSLPFSGQIHKKRVMKRKKRKRVEDAVDASSYMSEHNVFSYCEKKRSLADGMSMEDCGNLVTPVNRRVNGSDEFELHDGWPVGEIENDDSSLEQILWKIETVQLQARKLKARIDKLVSENSNRFFSINRSSLHATGDGSASNQNQSMENPVGAPVRLPYTLSQHISEPNMVDLMPESTVSGHGEVTYLPDMIESTEQLQIGVSCEDTEDEFLIHGQSAKEELQDFGTFARQAIEKTEVPEQNTDFPATVPGEKRSVQTNRNSISTSRPTVRRGPKRRGRRRGSNRRFS